MAKLKHIAITTHDPGKVAEFYKEAFGLREVGRKGSGDVFLTDGYIDLTILTWRTEKHPDVGANGPNYSGIHHIGFHVDDLELTCDELERVEAQQLTPRPTSEAEPPAAETRNYAVKWIGPDGVIIDVSQTDWQSTS